VPGYPFDPDRVPEAAASPPGGFDAALAALRQAVQGPALESEMRRAWLQWLTGYAFDVLPLPLPERALRDEEWVQGDPRFPVVCAPAGPDELHCAANGYVFTIPAHPGVQGLVRALNRGRALPVGGVVRECSGAARSDTAEIEVTPDGVRAFLETLCRVRAITVCDAGPEQAGAPGQPQGEGGG
jgi:hypothetical protein